jgi:serine/threonine protein kinase
MVQTVQDVFGLLLRSGLLPGEEAKALLSRWESDAKDRNDPQRFVAWLVSMKQLTDYQGALLVRGFAEGFFLNDYKVLERLGRGRMAGVYKAQHKLGQIVAIKVLPPSKAREPNLKSRFFREAKLALQLKHPNVVRAFQVGEANGLHYLVMEHLEGETFADLFARRGKLTPGEAVRLTHQTLLGLQHIHDLGLVHRDIKPSNLMLVYPGGVPADETLTGVVKVLDLGLGRQLLEDGPTSDDTALTSEGVVLGTPDYMAPEQARDPRATDIRADIYSLGCVLYHALAGRPPFPDTNLLNLMIRHATEEPQALRELNPAVPDGLQQIVNWMMAKEPGDRYASPERAAQALQVFLASESDVRPAPEDDAGMRTYLGWLEEQVVHADLPSWLAEMDTVTATDMRRSRMSAGESIRSAVPARPAKPPRPSGEISTASEKTKVVRKLSAANRPIDRPPPVPFVEPPPPACEPSKNSPVVVPSITEAISPSSIAASPPPPAPAKEPETKVRKKGSRRELLVFAVGAIAGAVVAIVGLLVAIGLLRSQPSTPEESTPRHGKTRS